MAASQDGKLPDLNTLVSETDRLRMKRMILHWKKKSLPKILTHNLCDDRHDELLNELRRLQLWNKPEVRVKVIYHPDFITSTNPLFGMDYTEFVRGCHLGIFPSYYEPWGYTPLEAKASGIPTVTSDLAGFGAYIQENIPEPRRRPVHIIQRYQQDFTAAVRQLTDYLHGFCQLNRRERIALRNQAEELSATFDWQKLYNSYKVAYRKAWQVTKS